MWGAANVLSFLLSPAGRAALIVLAFLAWGAYQRHDATQDCEAAELRQQLEESQRQLVIAQGIAEAARERADATEAAMTELRGIADGLAEEVRASGGGCVLDPDVRERLQRIR